MPKRPAKAEREYRRWVASHPCQGCGCEDDTRVAHHLTFCGTMMGGKPKECYLVCLCYWCHIEDLHRHGEKTFWAKYGFELDQVKEYAENLYRKYHDL
jgi:hypothetical protein